MKGKIYGVSSVFSFGCWDHQVYVFSDRKAAERWLATEEFGFRERELMTKTKAIRLAGRSDVENAQEVSA